MSCPVYEDGSTTMHVEKAEVRRLRAIEAAARAYIDSDDQDRIAEFDALEAALATGTPAEPAAGAEADARGSIINYLLSSACMTEEVTSAVLRDYAVRIRNGAHRRYPNAEPATGAEAEACRFDLGASVCGLPMHHGGKCEPSAPNAGVKRT